MPEFPMQPSNATLSFSGHETFVLRYGWLKKAYEAVCNDRSVFLRDDAVVSLGVGRNMVRSMRHWALASGVLAEEPKSRGTKLRPTEFGDFLFGRNRRDPFLEDINSLWLIHWKLSTNELRSTTWHWAFNFLRSTEFSIDALVRSNPGGSCA